MRFFIFSDVHANAVAFEAVLRHAAARRWDEAVFLGDIVGYYTEPEACVALLRDLGPKVAILGNHDAMLLAEVDGARSKDVRTRGIAADVVRRHAQVLPEADVSDLRAFQPHACSEHWEATHGSPDLDKPWAYLSGLPQAQEAHPFMQRDLLFFGHTHVPVAYVRISVGGKSMWRSVSFRGERATYRLPPNAQVLFNPGAVGQPRDGVPLASYAIFDQEARVLELYRVDFDIAKVQRQLRNADYEPVLGQRLEQGR